MRTSNVVRVAALVLAVAWEAPAVTAVVGPGQSIQAAIVAASSGDVVQVLPGTYVENLDFLGKAIRVVGAGPASIVQGTGSGSVVRFANGESSEAVLDGFTITGGQALDGGGIYVRGASPTIVRNVVTANRAGGRGSGVYLEASFGLVANNLVTFNITSGGDPHGIQIQSGAPTIVNNTIAMGDSNGVFIARAASPIVTNNIIATNGSRPFGFEVRGRGICDFGVAPVIRYNVFWRNRRGAVLSSTGVDYRRVRSAEAAIGAPRFVGNRDANPRFVNARAGDFRLGLRSRAVDAGDPDPTFADHDGSPNDAGHMGGPLAPVL